MGPSKFSFIAIKDSNSRHTDSISQTQRVIQGRVCCKKFNTEAMMLGKMYLVRSTKDI